MNNKICVLISGIEGLDGLTALQLVERFDLKEYGGVVIADTGKFWYANFDPVLIKNDVSDSILNNLTELLQWFGIRKIIYRLDQSHVSDSQIDFQIHIVRMKNFITIPKPRYQR